MIRRFLALTTIAAITLLPGLLEAQDQAARDAAREQFTQGVAHYEAGHYQQALAAFQEAYRLAPHPTVRVNMANCYEHLDRPLEALHHFERFLAESENPSRQQRREVEAAVARLERQLGEVRLSIAPDGATVVIDNAETRRAPVLEPLRLTAGTHHIAVRMDGYRTENTEVQVEGGETHRVSISLQRGEGSSGPVASSILAPRDSSPASETGSPSDPQDDPIEGDPAATGDPGPADTAPSEGGGGGFELRLTPSIYIAGGATVAFGVTALGTGIGALAANSDFEAAVERVRTTTGIEQAQARIDGRAAADLANTLSIVTDVFLIATIAAAGATVVFIVFEGLSGGDEAASDDVALIPFASPNAAGLLLNGGF